MEVLGGNGYVEEAPLARIYRESPLNSIWEGSGNVMCLDTVRAAHKSPEAVDVVLAEIERGCGGDRRMAGFVTELKGRLRRLGAVEATARADVETLVLALQAALLLEFAPSAVSDAFVASRIAGDHGGALGTLPTGLDFHTIVKRAQA